MSVSGLPPGAKAGSRSPGPRSWLEGANLQPAVSLPVPPPGIRNNKTTKVLERLAGSFVGAKPA